MATIVIQRHYYSYVTYYNYKSQKFGQFLHSLGTLFIITIHIEDVSFFTTCCLFNTKDLWCVIYDTHASLLSLFLQSWHAIYYTTNTASSQTGCATYYNTNTTDFVIFIAALCAIYNTNAKH